MADSLNTIRNAVRNRADISLFDPMFDDDNLNRQINMAYRRIQRVQPDGWWFQHGEFTRQNGNTATNLFDVLLTTPNDARMIRKVYAVCVSLDNAYYQVIPPRERTDQLRLSGGRTTDGFPMSWRPISAVGWTAGGNRRQLQIAFEPPLPALAWVKYIGVVDQADLDEDADTALGLPTMMTDLIVEQTVAVLTRQRKRSTGTRARASELSLVQGAAEEWMLAARRYFDAPYAGTGSPMLHSGRV